MELNKPPVVKNVLVMTNHFTRYVLAVVTKDQMAKTVVKVFYERFTAVFGVSSSFGVPSSVNQGLQAVGNGEWYLHLE